jgi:hypothetical protein
MSFALTHLIGFGAVQEVASGALPTLSYQTAAADATDATSYTFSSQAIGTDTGSTRTVLLAIYGLNVTALRTISSLTVGGVSGTLLHSNSVSSGSFSSVAFYAFTSVSGTTATVAVTWSGQQLRCQIGLWAAYDLSSLTPVATASSTSASATLNVNTSADGMVLAAGYGNASATFTWTGVTERYDAATETVGFSVADASGVTAESPRTVSASQAGSPTLSNSIAISLR